MHGVTVVRDRILTRMLLEVSCLYQTEDGELGAGLMSARKIKLATQVRGTLFISADALTESVSTPERVGETWFS